MDTLHNLCNDVSRFALRWHIPTMLLNTIYVTVSQHNIIKGKVHSQTGHEGPDGEQRYGSTLSIPLALYGGGW